MSMLRSWAAAGTAAAVAALMAACGGGGDTDAATATATEHTESAATADHGGHHSDRRMTVELSVLSSAPQWVSGGDARIHVRAAPGSATRSSCCSMAGALDVALEEVAPTASKVWSAACGSAATGSRRKHRPRPVRDAIVLTNWPITGPMFTGPQQTPFVCTTIQGAVGRQPQVDSPSAPGYRGDRRAGATDRLQPQLLDRHLRHLPLPQRPTTAEAAAGRRPRPADMTHRDAGRRAHGRLRRPARDRVDQPLPLQHRDAGAGGRETRRSPTPACGTASCCTGSRAAWRSATRQGTRARRLDEPGRAGQGWAIVHSQRQQHRHALQHEPRRRDGDDDQGALHRALRRAAVHRRASAARAARSSST